MTVETQYTAAMRTILKSIPATVSPDGSVTLSEPIKLPGVVAAMVTLVLDEDDGESIDMALASESALAKDWNHPDEDEAWAYLQEETSS
ncbi:hypothetical protein BH23VER1_BH23VER1_05430 [soil metagenome]